jgi:hypothetical protein
MPFRVLVNNATIETGLLINIMGGFFMPAKLKMPVYNELNKTT